MEQRGLIRTSTASRRLAGSTGKEAYARVEQHSKLLRRKGSNNPGPLEQTAYILQYQFAAESARWISLANADEKISDAALAARREHLRNFLNEQGPVTIGDRIVASSSTRAAVEESTTLIGNPLGLGGRGGAPPGSTHGTRERHGQPPSTVLQYTRMP